MNNIHEKDWAEDCWSGFSGMNDHSDWCTVDKEVGDKPVAHTDDKKNSNPTVDNEPCEGIDSTSLPAVAPQF